MDTNLGWLVIAALIAAGCAGDATSGDPTCSEARCDGADDVGDADGLDTLPSDIRQPDGSPEIGDAAMDDALIADAGPDAPDPDAEDDTADLPDLPEGGLVAVPAPDRPPVPARVEVISVTLVTGPAEFNGTPNAVEVCVGATCFPFAIDEIDTTERGANTVLHRAVGGVDPTTLDSVSVTIRGDNAWRPSCLDVRLDGRPVQCADLTGTILSDDPDEAPSATWRGPLTQSCTTCQPGTLTHGTVVGLPGTDTVRVWARTDATRLVGLELSTVEDDADPVPVAWAWPTPATDFTTQLVATGLDPDRTYWYRLTVDGQPQGPLRPIRTAPGEASEVSIGVGSCAKEADQQPAIFTQLASKDLDAFLFVGDSHYGNVQNLQGHWHHGRAARSVPERQAFFGAVPTGSIWDDHDFVGNNSNSSCRGRDEALRAFSDYWPNPPRTDPTPGVHFKTRFGPTEIFMLDCRYHRPAVGDPAQFCDVDGPGNTDHSAGPLGAEQLQWLLDGLSVSTAPFKIVACGSLLTGGVDSWASFPDSRERLLTSIHARAVSGVVFVSGDIHRSEAKVIARDDGYDFLEIISSPLAQYPHSGLPRTQCDAPREGRLYCDPYNSFVVLRADAGPDPELQALFYDEFGQQRFAVVRRLSELGGSR